MKHPRLLVTALALFVASCACIGEQEQKMSSPRNTENWTYSEIRQLVDNSTAITIKKIKAIEILDSTRLRITTARDSTLSGSGEWITVAIADGKWTVEKVETFDK